jgi:hypothetical protein
MEIKDIHKKILELKRLGGNKAEIQRLQQKLDNGKTDRTEGKNTKS